MTCWKEILCRPLWFQPSGFPGIGEKEVHVWRWNYHAHARGIDLFLKTLDPTERERADCFVMAEDRDRYIVNHGILRCLLSGYSGCHPKEISFTRNDFGKPFMRGGVAAGNVDFNMSDSGQMGIAAVGRGFSVGVDIELIRPIADKYLLIQEAFAGEEFMLLDGIGDEHIEEVFFFCWTRKEALIKAIGTGLSTSLKEFSTIPDYRPIYLGANKNVEITSFGIDWQITSHWAEKGYLSALATSKDVMRIDYFDLGAARFRQLLTSCYIV